MPTLANEVEDYRSAWDGKAVNAQRDGEHREGNDAPSELANLAV